MCSSSMPPGQILMDKGMQMRARPLLSTVPSSPVKSPRHLVTPGWQLHVLTPWFPRHFLLQALAASPTGLLRPSRSCHSLFFMVRPLLLLFASFSSIAAASSSPSTFPESSIASSLPLSIRPRCPRHCRRPWGHGARGRTEVPKPTLERGTDGKEVFLSW